MKAKTRITRLVLWCAAALLLSAVSALSAEPVRAADFITLEKKVYESFRKGDYPSLYDDIEKLLLSFPDAAESSLYFSDLVRLYDVAGAVRVKKTLEDIMARCEASRAPHRNLYGLLLRLEMEKLLGLSDPAAAANYGKLLSPLRQWRLAGPYFSFGPGDLNHAYEPEIIRNYRDGAGPFKTITVRRNDGWFDYDRHLYSRGGVFYLVSSLQANGPVKLRIQANESYVLFVNGREVLKNLKGAEFRTRRVVRVSSRDGFTVMIKCAAKPGGMLRVLLTGDDDGILHPRTMPDRHYRDECDAAEQLDYPFEAFVAKKSGDPAGAFARLAAYFYELESEEAVRYYRLALSRRNTETDRYFLAQCMIDLGGDAETSALALEGWGIMNRLTIEHPGFIPAAHKRFHHFLSQRNYREAFDFGSALTKKAPLFLPHRRDFLRLLDRLNYETEFLEETALLERSFPGSPAPKLAAARYFVSRNPQEAVKRCREVLDAGFNLEACRLLISLYRQMDRPEEALKLIERCDAAGDFRDERVDLLVSTGKYREAKELLYQNTLRRQDPDDYRRLGLINYLQNDDPSMEWGRMLALGPSGFPLSDLMGYLREGTLDIPFDHYRVRPPGDIITKWRESGEHSHSSRVLFREWVIILTADGGSRFFCEELIHVRDQKAIDKWGEYKINLPGTLVPVHARVYFSKGGHSDSHRIEKVNGRHYLTLASLAENSLVHVAYYLDNPFPPARFSNFSVTPLLAAQDYSEPLDYFHLTVAAPETMDPGLYRSGELAFIESKERGLSVYRAEIKSAPARAPERYAGSSRNYLPFIALSGMRDLNDFVRWYTGLLIGTDTLEGEPVRKAYSGGTVDELVKKVYGFVAKDIDLTGTVLYYPERCSDVHYRKKGTSEDKTLLARSMLAHLGVRSYIAFARKAGSPDPGAFVSPEIFDAILLYVPLAPGKGLWLDFSNPYHGLGVVDEPLERATALVLVDDGYELMKIETAERSRIEEECVLRLDKDGNARIEARAKLYGYRGIFRQQLRQARRHEETISGFFGSIFPSLSLDEFTIENLESIDRPLLLSARGACFNVATPLEDTLVVQALHGTSDLSRYILSAARKHPLYLDFDVRESTRCRYILPADFIDAAYDKTLNFDGPFGRARLELVKKPGTADLIVTKEIHVDKNIIDPKDYMSFLEFCRKIRAAEQQYIIIKKPAGAARRERNTP